MKMILRKDRPRLHYTIKYVNFNNFWFSKEPFNETEVNSPKKDYLMQ